MSGVSAWSDFAAGCYVMACLWGRRALLWRQRMVAMDAAGEVFKWAGRD